MRSRRTTLATSAVLLLVALPLIAAHGDDGGAMVMSTGSEMDMSITTSNDTSSEPTIPTYFRHPHQTGWMYAHIGLMVLSWAVVLPPSIMLSIARSRYHLPAQIAFHVSNGLGMFTGFVYRHSTPNLYEHNSHTPIGWIATSLTIAWTLMSLFVTYTEYKSRWTPFASSRIVGGNTLSARAMAQHNHMQPYRDRYSGDSAHGTDRNTASLYGSRQNSADSIYHKPEQPVSPGSDNEQRGAYASDDHDGDDDERRGFLGNNRVDRFLSRNVSRIPSQRASRVIRFAQIVLEKLLLLIGFVAITTGFVVWGGVFMDRQVFSGLAHFIKGGIFVWYGLLTVGRWMGAFAEFGWAWNVRPPHPIVARWKTRIPSAEFVESFVIWLYGATNVFLEHLNSWGKAWSSQDLEHISITMLFFGGGLLGMLVESQWARELLNTSVVQQRSRAVDSDADAEADPLSSPSARINEADHDTWSPPLSSRTSLNPLPAMVILLLGLMMSSHHQSSMVSTMLHAQWGKLFCGFALARGGTYALLYISPPKSHFPSRPPTELVAAFCLVAGGLLFMISARDTVFAIESNGLDAMAVFTVTMGFTGVVMAWEVLCFALKGWASRKEKSGAA